MLMNRGSFPDFFLQDMLPELTNLIMDKYQSKPSKIKMVFNWHGTTKAIEQSTTVGTAPAAPEIPEGESVNYFAGKQGYDKTYTMVKYGLGSKSTEEMVDDDQWDLIRKFNNALGKSIFETQEIKAANVFNNGFSTNGPDGVPLFSQSHPLLGGGTYANTPAAGTDLTQDTLQDALIALANTRDDENKHAALTPKILLIPVALKFVATEILKSQQRSDTAENAINALMEDGLTIVTWDYLTDTGAWFVGTAPDEHELHYYERRAPRVEGGYDFDSGSGKTKMTTRFDVGYGDARGWYGAT